MKVLSGNAERVDDETVLIDSNSSVKINASDGTIELNRGDAVLGSCNDVKITMNDGELQVVAGGLNVDGGDSVTGNSVVINGGSVGVTVVGGCVWEDGSANENKVIVTNGTIGIEEYGYVSGGYVDVGDDGSGNAGKNEVAVSGGTINCNVYGGWIDETYVNGSANENKVTISGGVIVGNESEVEIYGGYVVGEDDGYGNTVNGSADGNIVTISGGTIGATESEVEIYGGRVYGDGFGEGLIVNGSANGNTVTISGGTIGGDESYVGIMGGQVYGDDATINGSADGNTVTVSGCTIGGDESYVDIFGGFASGTGSANNNKVMVSGVNVGSEGVVGGGYAYGNGSANGNTVTISGENTGISIIVGGYSEEGNAINNTVNLYANAKFATLFGGMTGEDGTGDVKTGNTLNVRGSNLTVKGIENFENINFYVPSDAKNGDTVLTVKENVNIQDTTINAGVQKGSELSKGDSLTLLKSEKELTGTAASFGKVTETDFIDYDMKITQDGNSLKGTITSGGSTNEVSKSPVETMTANLEMINMGLDQVARTGFNSAAAAIKSETAQGADSSDAAIFANISGSNVKAESGSHIDIDGWNFNLGFAKEIENNSGKLLVAPIVEYGHGDYDSYLDNGVHADGNSKYWGAGLMARQTNNNGFYYEGSIIGGKSDSDYSSSDIGSGVSYDSDALFVAAHLGAGKVVEIDDASNINYYGKFFYTHLGGDDVTLSNGADYSFDSSESKRIMLGSRWTRSINAKNSLYAGLAWQYEFDAEARATVKGIAAPSPSMQGHTGIMELGWKVQPSDAPMDVDLGFMGYTGKTKGVSLNLNLNWKF